jgi:hypothetical protein
MEGYMKPTPRSTVAAAAMTFLAAAGGVSYPLMNASPAYADGSSARIQQLQGQIRAEKAKQAAEDRRGAAADARGAAIDAQMNCYIAVKTECKGRVPVGIRADGMNSCDIKNRVLKDRSLCPTPTTSTTAPGPG